MHFCVLCRNSRWLPKMMGKLIVRKVSSPLCSYPAGTKKIRQNRFILPYFQVRCVFFFILCRNSRWLPKMVRKQFLGKVTSKLCRYFVGPKFCRNHSISHRFQDKCIFVFYAEIQDGCQNGRKTKSCQLTAFFFSIKKNCAL